jgi:PTS system ascorbate-specific IIA component
MFNEKNSKQINKKITWKRAIQEGVKLLHKNKIASMELYDAILESTKKNGAYWILERGIALAHAPIGNYNKKPGVSLIWLKNEIQFNDEKKYAKLIITLSAVDSNSHIKYIKEFGNIFTNKNLKRKLLDSKSLKDFLKHYKKKGGDVDN